MFPETFDKKQYIAWHESYFKNDTNLLEKIEGLRETLKTNLKNDLKFIAELLYYLIPSYNKEYKLHYETDLDFHIPLADIDDYDKKMNKQYDLLFKSTDSIINKLWRKNKENKSVEIANINVEITDLVRTEITCSTLFACSFIAKRLVLERINLPNDYRLKQQLDEKVESIDFEPEMKMASGYFAYHGVIKLKNSISIEIQIYSTLMAKWRRLSHKLYEKVRLNPIYKHDYGTSESRLISLGHLLHLAECEIEWIEKQMKNK